MATATRRIPSLSLLRGAPPRRRGERLHMGSDEHMHRGPVADPPPNRAEPPGFAHDDSRQVEVINTGEELLVRAKVVARQIEERVGRAMDGYRLPPPHTPEDK